MGRVIGLLFYRADRSASVDDRPVPALLALLGHGDRRQRDGAVSSVRASLRPARLEHLRRSLFWRHFKSGGWSEALSHRLLQQTPAGPRGRLPSLLALLHRALVDDRAVPALLAHQDRHRSDGAVKPLFFYGHHDDKSYAVQFPLFFHTASERQAPAPPSRRWGRRARIATGPAWQSAPSSRSSSGAPATTARTWHLLPLFWYFADRAATGRRPSSFLLAPALGRRDHRQALPALLLPAPGQARRQRSDQPDPLPALPLSPRRRDAPLRDVAGRLGAQRARKRRVVGPYVWFKNSNFDARFVRSSTPTSCAAPTDST